MKNFINLIFKKSPRTVAELPQQQRKAALVALHVIKTTKGN